MASGFVADTTSLPHVVSNLVNIVSAALVNIGFIQYMTQMYVPNLFILDASILVRYYVIRTSLTSKYDKSPVNPAKEAINDQALFRLSCIVLVILLAGYFVSGFINVSISVIAGVVAIAFLLFARTSPAVETKKVIKEAPWAIVFFSIGMYVVVYGLRNVGLTSILGVWIQAMADQGMLIGTIGMGFLAAFLSSVMNNLPTVMINVLAITDTN